MYLPELVGFSDPYCMLGIIPGSRASEILLDEDHKDGKEKTLLRKFSASLRDSIRGKSSKDKPKHVIPAKYIQSTKVIPNSLNPTWQEKFKLYVHLFVFQTIVSFFTFIH